MRAMFNADVATGKSPAGKNYQTKGPLSSFGWKNKLPDKNPKGCMVEGSFQKESVWAEIYAAGGT